MDLRGGADDEEEEDRAEPRETLYREDRAKAAKAPAANREARDVDEAGWSDMEEGARGGSATELHCSPKIFWRE